MLGCVRLRKKIAVLSISVLVVSILKIAYEFSQTARSAIDLSDRVSYGSRSPAMPHLSSARRSQSPFLLVQNTSGDPGSDTSLGSRGLWVVSRGRYRSDKMRAGVKINSNNSHHFNLSQRQKGHAQGTVHIVTGVPKTLANSSLLTSRKPVTANSSLRASLKLVTVNSSLLASRKLVTTMDKLQLCLVVIVCSKPENTDLRLAIRRTWGLELNYSHIVLRFVMGQDDTWGDILMREQALHGDVIRTDYLDTYENLSYKVLTAMSWVVDKVKAASHIMKIDDDTYVNLPYLLKELRENAAISDATRSYVMGAVCVNSTVIRDDGDKWFVSHLSYPSDVYPTYVFGGGYVMTRPAAESILAARWKRDYLHLEDVFITGILAKAASVDHVSHPGFAFWTSRRPSPCDIVTGRRLTAASLRPRQFYTMYSGVHATLRSGNWTKC